MKKESISQKFRLENIEEISNYFMKELDQNELMSFFYSKLYWIFTYFSFNSYLICFYFCFAFLVSIPIGITSYSYVNCNRIKICAATASIRKYEQWLRKRQRRMVK